jgi:choline dehydrogenase-like flavoprotein
MSKARILIAGGGISGLTTAIALTQRGFEVQVYEQSPELREFGTGVSITPNGSRVLIELGLQPALEEVASRPRRCGETPSRARNRDGSTPLRSGISDQPLTNLSSALAAPNHPSYPAAHGCGDGAAEAVLSYLFPRDAAYFKARAEEGALSRIWAGIHFRSDIDAGLALVVRSVV